MDSSPYSQPKSDAIPTGSAGGSQGVVQNRSIILGWEKLRILYNLILLGVGLLVVLEARKVGMHASEITAGVFLMAVGANAGFCIGPMSELYFCTFLQKRSLETLRIPMFALGLIMSLALFGLFYLTIGFGAI